LKKRTKKLLHQARAEAATRAQVIKRFLLLFFKKEGLNLAWRRVHVAPPR
jgi:hypothetical protein